MEDLQFFHKIGERLKNRCLLTEEQIAFVLKRQTNCNKLFGQIAVDLNFISEDDLLTTLTELYTIQIVSLDFLLIPKEILELLDFEIANKHLAVPFFADDCVIKIAIADPGDLKAIDEISAYFKNKNIKFYIAKKSQILHLLELIKNNDSNNNDPLFLLNKIIFEAIERNASDIHFEPNEDFIRIRIRIDGILNTINSFSLDFWPRIKTKLKLISKLNITENRKPQSGHTRIYLAGKIIDLRISTHPGIYGENFVIRIFNLSDGIKSLSELGFVEEDFLWLKKVISAPYGLFFVVGPTGSGKTTTLYSILKEINSNEINIMTLEDPVEYQIPGIKQLDLREEGLLSFSDGVRSILRQDPDILLIGEIRDEATASTAIRASLTGRLVLATLHAATPEECIRRLVDFGIKLSDLIPCMIGVFSQRLVRKKDSVTNKYNGRFPIAEYIFFSEKLKREILEFKKFKTYTPNKTFIESAKFAIDKNLTDIYEVKRVLGDVAI